MQRKLLSLLFAAAAYGIYRYTKMTPEQKSDLKRRGKEFLNKNMGFEDINGRKTTAVPVNQSNDY
ncbi:MAG TPA: hypothetical protein VF144_07505 [Chitinophagaceae bacterium]